MNLCIKTLACSKKKNMNLCIKNSYLSLIMNAGRERRILSVLPACAGLVVYEALCFLTPLLDSIRLSPRVLVADICLPAVLYSVTRSHISHDRK